WSRRRRGGRLIRRGALIGLVASVLATQRGLPPYFVRVHQQIGTIRDAFSDPRAAIGRARTVAPCSAERLAIRRQHENPVASRIAVLFPMNLESIATICRPAQRRNGSGSRLARQSIGPDDLVIAL